MRGLVILFALLLVVAGCQQAEVKKDNLTSVEPALEEPKPVVDTSKNVSVPKPKPAPVKLSIAPEIAVLFNKTSKIKTMQYWYYGPPNDALGLKYTIVDKKIKLQFPKDTRLSDGNFYDTIYLDLSTGKAVAYCESPQCQDTKVVLNATSAEYIRPTPQELIAPISFAKQTGTAIIDNRKVTVTDFAYSDGRNGTMWLDNTYGLPLRIIISGVDYEYRDFFFNSNDVKEVTKVNQ